MTVHGNNRKYARLTRRFQTIARIPRTSARVPGTTDNLSQGGAFIITPSWSHFQVDDQAEIEFFLPPTFTGQENTLVLRGPGTVKRIDKERLGIALEFQKQFKTFEASRRYEI